MNFINNSSSTLSEYFENIGKTIYSHKKFNKIVHDNINIVVFPNPSNRVLKEAIENISNFDSSYYILHTAHFTGNYTLVLTKFKKNIYKVFYYYNDNNDIAYSYYIHY
tara:strand:+ start:4610 stop:4933 length:324 start_codon:yes stop_codon:yes gene_type:complete